NKIQKNDKNAKYDKYYKDEINYIRLYETNYFEINIADFKSHNVDELVEDLKKINFHVKLDQLFLVDEGKEEIIWDFNIKIENDVYDAGQIGYLILSISKALESIDGIKVELEDWGTSSRWVRLKVKIKSDVAKIDLKELINKVRQNIEGVLYKKSLDEIQKFEAEKNKLNAETKKLIKETDNLDSKEISSAKKNLDLLERTLHIENMQADLEEKKLKNMAAKLDLIKKASELFGAAVVQQDGDVRISVNNCLFVEKIQHSDGAPQIVASIEQIEANEIKAKIRDDEED
ncbi:MAG TPA: hypothetical protein VJY62_09335, partial [Bacteroidia bacterium]|nr:hypothetical protein [Bacteroidia bacterium]